MESIFPDYGMLSLGLILIGAASDVAAEAAPIGIDDNLSVALISSTFVSAWKALDPWRSKERRNS